MGYAKKPFLVILIWYDPNLQCKCKCTSQFLEAVPMRIRVLCVVTVVYLFGVCIIFVIQVTGSMVFHCHWSGCGQTDVA
jgi:hypothetical protein